MMEERDYVVSCSMKRKSNDIKQTNNTLLVSKKQKNSDGGYTNTNRVESIGPNVCPLCYIIKEKFST